jgi:hypothetical protein
MELIDADKPVDVAPVMAVGEVLSVPEIRGRLGLPTACYAKVRSGLMTLERKKRAERVGTAWRRL